MEVENILINKRTTLSGIFGGFVDMLSFKASMALITFNRAKDEAPLASIKHLYHKTDPLDVLERDKNGILYSAKEVSRKKINRKLAMILASAGIVLLSVVYGPSVYYSAARIFGVDNTTQNILETARQSQVEVKAAETESQYIPPLDTSLPEVNMVSIPEAGIETEIHEAEYEEHESALREGVWRVSFSGNPSVKKPMILAAHRFGYLEWSIPYRLKNSFYNLPKASLGDRVEVVWGQRKYVYEIYAEEVSEEFSSDYSADLVLYTCKDLKSPVRIFKYAKLIEE